MTCDDDVRDSTFLRKCKKKKCCQNKYSSGTTRVVAERGEAAEVFFSLTTHPVKGQKGSSVQFSLSFYLKLLQLGVRNKKKQSKK